MLEQGNRALDLSVTHGLGLGRPHKAVCRDLNRIRGGSEPALSMVRRSLLTKACSGQDGYVDWHKHAAHASCRGTQRNTHQKNAVQRALGPPVVMDGVGQDNCD